MNAFYSEEPVNLLYGVECFAAGTMKHMLYLASHLHRDFKIHLIVSETYRQESLQSGVVQELQRCGIRVYFLPIAHRFAPASDVLNIIRIARYIHRNKIDIVHAHSSKAGVLFRVASFFSGVKSVYTPHCFYFTACRGVKRWFFCGLERLLSCITNRIVLAGNERRTALKTHVIPADKIVLINNALVQADYRVYPKLQICEELGIPASCRIIGGIGRLVPQKNWKTFLCAIERVAPRFPDVVFLIVGEGEERSFLEESIKKWAFRERIFFVGQEPDISRVFSCLDAYVSTSAWEGLPYTYLEAQLFGIPMFISRTDYIEEVLCTSGVQLFPCGDDLALAELLSTFLSRTGPSSEPRCLHSNTGFSSFIQQHRQMYWELLSR